MKNMVDIVVVTYNRIDYFKTFVKFLYLSTEYPFRLIVVDNGSDDGTREHILGLEEKGVVWKHVFNDKNLPLAAAFTEGYKQVESEYFVTVADDMIPILRKTGPCWLTVFMHKMRTDKDVGCINFVAARRLYDKFMDMYGEYTKE